MNQQEERFWDQKTCSSLRNTNQTARRNAAVQIACPTPRGMIVSRCKQVSRLSLILLAYLPAARAVVFAAFVRFTVTGIARNFHPCSHGTPEGMPRIAAQIHRLFICRYALYAMWFAPSIHLHIRLISQKLCVTILSILKERFIPHRAKGCVHTALFCRHDGEEAAISYPGIIIDERTWDAYGQQHRPDHARH